MSSCWQNRCKGNGLAQDRVAYHTNKLLLRKSGCIVFELESQIYRGRHFQSWFRFRDCTVSWLPEHAKAALLQMGWWELQERGPCLWSTTHITFLTGLCKWPVRSILEHTDLGTFIDLPIWVANRTREKLNFSSSAWTSSSPFWILFSSTVALLLDALCQAEQGKGNGIREAQFKHLDQPSSQETWV